MADVLAADEDDETADPQSFPPSRRKNSPFAAETRIRWRGPYVAQTPWSSVQNR